MSATHLLHGEDGYTACGVFPDPTRPEASSDPILTSCEDCMRALAPTLWRYLAERRPTTLRMALLPHDPNTCPGCGSELTTTDGWPSRNASGCRGPYHDGGYGSSVEPGWCGVTLEQWLR